jgi:N-acetylmuramoyl-L-alanine amidase
MKKICVSIGHSDTVGGAVNEKFSVCEYQIAKPICTEVVARLNAKLAPNYQAILIDAGRLRGYGLYKATAIDTNSPEIAIELHFDSFAGETKKMPSHPQAIYWGANARDKKFAETLMSEFDAVYKDKGWSKGKAVGIPAPGYDIDRYWLVHHTKFPTLIVEGFFMKNDEQVDWAINNPKAKEELVNILTNGLIKCVLSM